MKRRLFPNEREIQSWKSLTLTTHRIIHLATTTGLAASTSIPLAHIQCTKMARSDKPGWLGAAGLAAFFAMGAGLADNSNGGIGLALISLVCALVYLATRRLALVIASAGGAITTSLDPRERASQTTRDFLDAVDHAASIASGSSSRVIAPELFRGPPEVPQRP